ncbi:MAG: DUF6773 family protein [Bacillota bacterium]|nr:DUF6773 family protein [Bacillota bacterium]
MKRIEDERILIEKRKINSRAFSYVFIGLWLIILYRQFILDQHVSQYIDIFVLTIGISFYVSLRNVFKGLYQTYRKKETRRRNMFIGAVVGTATFTVVNYIMNDFELSNIKDLGMLILSALIFFVAWTGAQYFMIRKSEKKADEEIEE